MLLKSRGKLFISSSRLDAINLATKSNFKIAILDDGLQDKSINYDLSLVCFNNLNWIGNGLTIPSGPLRESISNLKRYKHIFLLQAPEMAWSRWTLLNSDAKSRNCGADPPFAIL